MKRQQGNSFDGGQRRFGSQGPGPRSYGDQGGGHQGPRGPRRFDNDQRGEPRGEGGYGGERQAYGRPERSQGGGFDRQNGRSFGPKKTFRREDAPQGGFNRPQRPAFSEERSSAPAQASAPMAAPKARPVPVARLKEGVAQANRALAEVIEQFGSTLSGDYDISALEVQVSFSEDGRFLGFGQGGACTMTLSVTPLSAEEILEGENDELMDMDEDFEEEEASAAAPELAADEAPQALGAEGHVEADKLSH